jgi:hypothetical protein
MRANASDAPPGVCGTMIRTGLVGKLVVRFCADTELSELTAHIKTVIKIGVSLGKDILKISILGFLGEKIICLITFILKLFFI